MTKRCHLNRKEGSIKSIQEKEENYSGNICEAKKVVIKPSLKQLTLTDAKEVEFFPNVEETNLVGDITNLVKSDDKLVNNEDSEIKGSLVSVETKSNIDAETKHFLDYFSQHT